MSGGSFNYAYHHAKMFADEVVIRLSEQGKVIRHHGWEDVNPSYTPEEAAALQYCADQAMRAAKLMKAAEWFCSGDTGTDTFLREVEAMK